MGHFEDSYILKASYLDNVPNLVEIGAVKVAHNPLFRSSRSARRYVASCYNEVGGWGGGGELARPSTQARAKRGRG